MSVVLSRVIFLSFARKRILVVIVDFSLMRIFVLKIILVGELLHEVSPKIGVAIRGRNNVDKDLDHCTV